MVDRIYPTELLLNKANYSDTEALFWIWIYVYLMVQFPPKFMINGTILILIYSWLSLSRPRLSWITAYLEVKIWSLPKDENLTTGNKILWKRGEITPSNFPSFSQHFQYISNFKNPITYTFVKCGCSIYFFLISANLICRGMDILEYFKESLWIRDFIY